MFIQFRKKTLRLVLLIGVLVLQACKVELYSGLDERQANQMISELMKHGIQAKRYAMKDGKLAVSVDENLFSTAVQILEASDLPEAKFVSLGEVFKGNGLVASPIQEKAQLIYAMSQELSNTVSKVDGIRTARVHVDIPEENTRMKSNKQASAAVFVRYNPGVNIDILIPKIKSLVAASLSDLDYERVTVIPVAASEGKIMNTPRMITWFGVLIPEKSVGKLNQLILFGSLLLAILTAIATWWCLKNTSGGLRTYRKNSE